MINTKEIGLNKAIKKIQDNEFNIAINILNKVIKYSKDKDVFVKGHIYRGNCHMGLKEYDKAFDDYMIVIRLDCKDAKVYYNMGLIAKNNEDYYLALKYFSISLELKPNYVFPLVNRGAVQMILGNYKLGVNDFEAANKVVKKDPLIFINKALVY